MHDPRSETQSVKRRSEVRRFWRMRVERSERGKAVSRRRAPRAEERRRRQVLAGEMGRRWSGRGRLRAALVYPNTYHVGMSNLGFQAVWSLFDTRDDVSCERVFAPDEPSATPVSLETGRPLRMFDLIAFSVSFELDLPRIVSLLERASIPPRSEERDGREPLIMAGGVVCAMNPEPLAPYLDLIFVGEGEELDDRFFDLVVRDVERARGGREHSGRQGLLEVLASVPGVYVPALYEPVIGPDHRLVELRPRGAAPRRIEYQLVRDLGATKTASVVLSPKTEFKETYLIETGRGCPHGCRFCLAGFVYRPFRRRESAQLRRWLDEEALPCRRLGLVGSALAHFPGLDRFISSLPESVKEVGVSSLRVDAVTPALVEALVARRERTLTIAPEAGSQRMRDVINKRLDETTIVGAAEQAATHGMKNLRLYFMVGLPWEEEDDIRAIPPLVEAMRRAFLGAGGKRVTVSINPFVPKPQTPFQWHPMAREAVLKHRLRFLARALSPVQNLRVITKSTRLALLQSLFARGGRPVGEAIAVRQRAGLSWRGACARVGVEMDDELYRERRVTELLPWDHIGVGVERHFLWEEYRRAAAVAGCPLEGDSTP